MVLTKYDRGTGRRERAIHEHDREEWKAAVACCAIANDMDPEAAEHALRDGIQLATTGFIYVISR